ncbi:MAG TPA: hypothetical protein VFK58_02810 [Sphingomicrobium sp.]|nr:hypothetical protein [Sphingomicrobium sp.]
MMKLTLTFGAALSLAALAACSQSGQDNASNADANAGMTASEGVLPIEDNVGNADTLGDQLDQLDNGSSQSGNSAAADSNGSGNVTNSY